MLPRQNEALKAKHNAFLAEMRFKTKYQLSEMQSFLRCETTEIDSLTNNNFFRQEEIYGVIRFQNHLGFSLVNMETNPDGSQYFKY